MELKQRLINESRYSIKCPYLMNPIGITIHNTDNDASAENEAAYMERRPEEVSFHIVVDEKEALQLIPFGRNAWHSGDGVNGTGNRKTIALEIARNFGSTEVFAKAQENAAIITAQICKQFGWGIDKIYTHRHWSGKNCPSRTDINKFKEKVKYYLNGSAPNIPVSPQANSSIKVGDKVKATGTYYATGQAIPGWVKNNTYEVIQVSGNKVLLGGIMSWVYSGEVSKVNSKPVTSPVSNKQYLNLKPHMQKWAIYKEGGPYTLKYKIGDLKPSMFGGISYEILGSPQRDVYIIQTRDYGRVGIWAPRDNDSTITNKPVY